MDQLEHLLNNNRQWAARISREQPGFFEQLAAKQSPEILMIGCADSRMPPSVLLDVPPGCLFVHRNIANVVSDTDDNALSVIQYAVDVLKVQHIILCGHYGCGGVQASMQTSSHGHIDAWLDHIRDVYRMHRDELESIEDPEERSDRLCELNVVEQAARVCRTDTVQKAWASGGRPEVHGWIYNMKTGLVKDLQVSVKGSA